MSARIDSAIDLAVSHFLPEAAHAALVVVHGLAEHRGRYAGLAGRCRDAGLATVTYDQRGHGESPGRRCDIDRFATFAGDLRAVIAATAASLPTLPVFVWGHSLGCLVALDCLLSNRGAALCLVTTGCPLAAFGAAAERLGPAAAWLGGLLPALRLPTSLDARKLSHDPVVQAHYRGDPLVQHSLTLRLAGETARAVVRVRGDIARLDTACLALHGAEDEIAPPAGSRRLIEDAGHADRRLVELPGYRHEVHNEERGDRFLELLLGWVDERVHATVGRPATA